MPSQRPRPAVGDYKASDREYDRLIIRIRRLAAHRGYDRAELMSPLLRRLMPRGRPSGDTVAEIAEMRERLLEAGLDAKTLAYLTTSVEAELELARLRLT